MTTGTTVHRNWVCTMNDGRIIIDWGNGKASDIETGEVFPLSAGAFTYPINVHQLDALQGLQVIGWYDDDYVFFKSMIEPAFT